MKSTHKALLLSALVFPGLGQIILKRYKSGLTLIAVSGLSVYRMMNIAMTEANDAVNRMLSQGNVIDIEAISQSAMGAGYSIYLNIIILCWFISLVDIWLARNKS